jgi:hypothetical protein
MTKKFIMLSKMALGDGAKGIRREYTKTGFRKITPGEILGFINVLTSMAIM